MLVVTDQISGGIGGKRGLSGSGETEEHRDVLGILMIDVRRTVHRKDVHVRQIVIHRVEDRLLHLPGVPGADDDDLPLLEALNDREAVLHPVLLGIVDLQVAGVVDDPVRVESVLIASVALMKSVAANSECQASSVTTETFNRYFASAPANPSKR